MYASRSFVFLVAFGVLRQVTSIPVNDMPFAKRGQCGTTLSVADSVANRLISEYFDDSRGGTFSSTIWTDANTLEDFHNLMLGEGSTTWGYLAADSNIGNLANLGFLPYGGIIDNSFDDSQWAILALWKMADYQHAQGQDNTQFLSQASIIYDEVAAQWDNTCNGGVWWSSGHNYKNSITNELFLLTSAKGYLRNNNPTYLQNAQKVWTWLQQSGLRNSQGLWNDGLDMSTCTNNGQTTWTYNQGVIASGLAALYVATGSSDTSLLDQAEITLDATIQYLTQDNILKETCDDVASGGASCNTDQQYFKGIWTKHLQYYLDNANDPNRVAKYSPFLGSQSSAVIHYGLSSTQDVASTWYAPDQGGAAFTAQSSASGLAALVAAAKYGPC